MSYTVVTDPSPFAANLQPEELVVQLDTGDHVAVRVSAGMDAASGNPVLKAWARAVNADGTTRLGPNGEPLQSAMSHTMSAAELSAVGSIGAALRIAARAVLGEDTAPLWTDPIHATPLQDWSIRSNLATAAHWGPVADLGSLL